LRINNSSSDEDMESDNESVANWMEEEEHLSEGSQSVDEEDLRISK